MASKQRHPTTHAPFLALLAVCAITGQIGVGSAEPSSASVTPIQVTAELARTAWYPLDKSRIAIFQEADNLPGEYLMESLRAHPELRIDSFRLLLSQGNLTQTFNRPDQFQMRGNQLTISADADLRGFLDYSEDHGILPIVTLFNIPRPLQKVPNTPRVIPEDCTEYAAAAQRYVALFKNHRPMAWEIWNEPNLEQYIAGTNRLEDYLRLYEAVFPAVRKGDPNALILGPASAGTRPAFCEPFFKLLATKPELRPDYISFHHYGRHPWRPGEDSSIDELRGDFVRMRKIIGDDYNHVPFMITEYEHYPAGVTEEIREQQLNREAPMGAATFLEDVEFFLRQPDIAHVHWNRFRKNGREARPGGVFDYDGNPLPHYFARQAFATMPEERVPLTISGEDNLRGMASVAEDRAGILLWNTKPGLRQVEVNLNGSSTIGGGKVPSVRISRYDSTIQGSHAGPAVETRAYQNTLPVELDGPGFVLLELITDSKTAASDGLQQVKWLRNYRLCGRENGALTGNYAIPDPREWTIRLGTRKPGSETAGGFLMSNAPQRLQLKSTVRGRSQAPDLGALIIYQASGGNTAVVLAPSANDGHEIAKLPWQDTAASYRGKLPASGVIDLDKLAPNGWSKSSRQAAVFIWMRGNTADTQAVVHLTGPTNP